MELVKFTVRSTERVIAKYFCKLFNDGVNTEEYLP